MSHEVSGTLSYFTCKMRTFSHPPDLLQLGIQLKVFCEMPTNIIIPHDNSHSPNLALDKWCERGAEEERKGEWEVVSGD